MNLDALLNGVRHVFANPRPFIAEEWSEKFINHFKAACAEDEERLYDDRGCLLGLDTFQPP